MADAEYRRPRGTEVLLRVPEWRTPLILRAGTSDPAVFRQVVLGRELEIELNDPPQRILDAGANIGISVRVFAERWPQARILAIELESGNVELLRRNSVAYEQVTVRRGALWSGRGAVVLRDPGADEWMFSATEASVGASETIPSLGVEDLLDEAGWETVDLLKLDIEGGEIAVFNASDRWLHRCRCIVVELHDRYLPGCKQAMDDALDPSQWTVAEHGEYLVAQRRQWPANGPVVREGG